MPSAFWVRFEIQKAGEAPRISAVMKDFDEQIDVQKRTAHVQGSLQEEVTLAKALNGVKRVRALDIINAETNPCYICSGGGCYTIPC